MAHSTIKELPIVPAWTPQLIKQAILALRPLAGPPNTADPEGRVAEYRQGLDELGIGSGDPDPLRIKLNTYKKGGGMYTSTPGFRQAIPIATGGGGGGGSSNAVSNYGGGGGGAGATVFRLLDIREQVKLNIVVGGGGSGGGDANTQDGDGALV